MARLTRIRIAVATGIVTATLAVAPATAAASFTHPPGDSCLDLGLVAVCVGL
jgi:hypothetical protein